MGKNQILKWGRNRQAINWIRKSPILSNPLLRGMLRIVRNLKPGLRQSVLGDRYFVMTDKTERAVDMGAGVLTTDGHPSISPDGEWVITDTYALDDHIRQLILYHLETNRRIDVAALYSLPDNKNGVDDGGDITEMRSDLHPRWNRSGTQVCIDSVHEGTKQVYVVDVEEILGSEA
jgi:hypothetical protein